MAIPKYEVLQFLKAMRPDVRPEEWRNADVATVLTWALEVSRGVIASRTLACHGLGQAPKPQGPMH